MTIAKQDPTDGGCLPSGARTRTRQDPALTLLDLADPIDAALNAGVEVTRLLHPRDAAAALAVTVRTLERWRITGEGPRYVKVSRSTIRYSVADIDAFVSERLRINTLQ